MKRIWAILLSIAIMLSLTVTVFAVEERINEPNMDMTVSENHLYGEDKVTITLSNSKPVKFDTMTFHIDFDSEALTCTDVTYTYMGRELEAAPPKDPAQPLDFPFVGHSTETEANSTGTAGFYYCNVDKNDPGNGKGISVDEGQLVATITFEVKKGISPSKTYDVKLIEDSDGYNHYNSNADGSHPNKTETLTFMGDKAVLLGDVNGDGSVDSKDVLMLRRAVSGIITLTEDQKARANVFHDSDIDSKDVLTLRRAVSGLITLS